MKNLKTDRNKQKMRSMDQKSPDCAFFAKNLFCQPFFTWVTKKQKGGTQARKRCLAPNHYGKT